MDYEQRGCEINYLQHSILTFFKKSTLSILSVEMEESLKVFAFAEEEGVRIYWNNNNFLIPWPEALSLFMGSAKVNSLISLIEASKS